jgi:hypothetical protein
MALAVACLAGAATLKDVNAGLKFDQSGNPTQSVIETANGPVIVEAPPGGTDRTTGLTRKPLTAEKPRGETRPYLPDGSYLSRIYASTSDRRKNRHAILVRVIDYHLDTLPQADPLYRLITTVLDHTQAPAEELAALYHQRWEIETALDELKTHLRGAQIVLRSKTPELVKQEFYGLLMAHFAVRGLMQEAALQAEEDPDRLSFLHSVRVVQRRMARSAAIPPSAAKNGS